MRAELVLVQLATSQVVRAELISRREDGFVVVSFAGTRPRIARELTVAEVMEIEKGESDAADPLIRS